MVFQAVLILAFPAFILAHADSLPSSCTPEYEALGFSTMCTFDDNPEAEEIPVTAEEKEEIILLHNEYRANVSPTATNMQKMYWDDELAIIARKWARVCMAGHDTLRGRNIPGYGIPVGQNYAVKFGKWSGAIDKWYMESQVYVYGEPPNDYLGEHGWAAVAHYTQVVRDLSARIGCGKAKCPELGSALVCNYAGGNPLYLGEPYISGTPCSACPDTCQGNLCDCQGKICLNGGTLDPNTCECTCQELFTGDTCDTPHCSTEENGRCNSPSPNGFPEDLCRYRNIRLLCPIMCNICPAK